MRIVHEDDKTLVLASEKEPAVLLNALRRAVISETPAMAISEVDFYENNSPLINEYLSNRIGLTPLSWEDGVEDDARVGFSLNAEALEEPKTVYSRDLVSSDEKIKVFYENIPLVVLNKGQKLRLEAFATKGTAKQHARFQSAVASYGRLGEFKISEKCKKCSSPLKAFPLLEGKKTAGVEFPENSFLCGNCEKSDGDGKQFLFVVESFNNLSAREQYSRALKVLEAKTKALEKEFK
ncbi:MAG: DNA-directed RNA polymerase subunit D [Candidatus Micrarchaeota archaeon]